MPSVKKWQSWIPAYRIWSIVCLIFTAFRCGDSLKSYIHSLLPDALRHLSHLKVCEMSTALKIVTPPWMGLFSHSTSQVEIDNFMIHTWCASGDILQLNIMSSPFPSYHCQSLLNSMSFTLHQSQSYYLPKFCVIEAAINGSWQKGVASKLAVCCVVQS